MDIVKVREHFIVSVKNSLIVPFNDFNSWESLDYLAKQRDSLDFKLHYYSNLLALDGYSADTINYEFLMPCLQELSTLH